MQQALTQKPHLARVDYIRAIASVGVALFHLGGKALPVLKFGWLGVQMFFVLSGFIICWAIPQNYSWRMAGTFISKRLVRIEPPYLLSIVLVLAVTWLTVPNYTGPNWADILGHIAYLNNFTSRPYLSPVFWTLGIEFQYYLFVAIFFPLVAGKWGDIFLVAVCVLPYMITIPGSNLLGVFPFFVMGIIYYRYFTGRISGSNAVLLGLLIIIYAWLKMGWMPACAGAVTLLFLCSNLPSNKFIRFFAKISFSLYLTHDAIGSQLVVYLGSHLPKTIVGKGIAFSSGIVASILFAYLFYLTIEGPFMRLSKQISYKKVGASA